jgi:hypothetical protein
MDANVNRFAQVHLTAAAAHCSFQSLSAFDFNESMPALIYIQQSLSHAIIPL